MKELSLKMKRLFCLAVMALCILTPITAKSSWQFIEYNKNQSMEFQLQVMQVIHIA